MQRDRVLTRPFVLTMLAEFALCMSVGMLLAIVPVYADDELGVGSFGVAVAVAAVSPMVLVAQPIAGRYADRNGRRILIVAGGFIAAVTVAGYVLAHSLPLLVALRLLTGAGEAMVLVGAATMIMDLAPEDRRGEALSLFSLGLWGGLALGPLLGELVLGDARFDAVWLVAASCCLASGLIGLVLPETAPEREAEPDLERAARPSGGDRARSRARVHRSRLRRPRDVRRALRARARPRRCRLGLPRVLGGRRRDPRPRAAGARPHRAEAHVPNRARADLGGALHDRPLERARRTVRRNGRRCLGHALAFPSLMTLAVNAGPESERSSVVGTFSAFTELGFLVGALSLGAVASAMGYGGVFVVCAFGPLVGVVVLSRISTSPPVAVLDAA